MSKLSSLFRRLALPALLAAGTLLSACEGDKAKTPARPEARPIDSLDIYNDTTGISGLRADFALTPLGAKYLHFADSAGIAIVFNERRCTIADSLGGAYSARARTIFLSSSCAQEDQLTTLAHELEHGYNDIILGTEAVEQSLLSPFQRFALMRLEETDAYVAQSCYELERKNFLQGKPSAGGMSTQECHDFFFKALPIVNEIYIHHLEKTGSILAELKPFLSDAHQPDSLHNIFLSAHKKTPSPESYEKLLRGLGGQPFNGEGALAAAEFFPLKEVIEQYPFIGMSQEDTEATIKKLAIYEVINRGIIRAVAGTQGIQRLSGAP